MINDKRMVDPFKAVSYIRDKHKTLSTRLTDADAYALFKSSYN